MTTGKIRDGRMVAINGADLHVREIGQGQPIVLVQPGLLSGECYEQLATLLAARFRVVTFDSRGHGRSTNPGGVLTYELLADDTVELIRALGMERPFVGGWSDGGEVALQVGLRHPGLARGLIAGGTSLEMGGSERDLAGLRAFFCTGANDVVDVDAFATRWEGSLLPMLRESHPGGEAQWQDVVRWSARMWMTYVGLTREETARITAPTLVAIGDRDEFVPVEEGVRLYRWLPNAGLAILPGSNHMRPVFEPASFASVLTDFVDRHS
ncbi:MAG TPA: alpha/beta hydrolase [Thermomicrobiales bacterium]|nr:alpha/beta hydrolase [Thermomicrobiales bacterium]